MNHLKIDFILSDGRQGELRKKWGLQCNPFSPMKQRGRLKQRIGALQPAGETVKPSSVIVKFKRLFWLINAKESIHGDVQLLIM